MNRTVYREIASYLNARRSCLEHYQEPGKSHLEEWITKHECRAHDLTRRFMPSGSGIDAGTTLQVDACTDDKLVFTTSYHHMNDGGYYDGWTEHTVTVKPSLIHELTIKISGRDRNNIKEYLHDCFDNHLRTTFEE